MSWLLKIRMLRKAQNMTLRELADKLNVSVQCVSNYEAERRGVDLETASKIAAALNCTVDDLIDKET